MAMMPGYMNWMKLTPGAIWPMTLREADAEDDQEDERLDEAADAAATARVTKRSSSR